jgi:hypothetical protein
MNNKIKLKKSVAVRPEKEKKKSPCTESSAKGRRVHKV